MKDCQQEFDFSDEEEEMTVRKRTAKERSEGRAFENDEVIE
jgi:hypothetical protein